MYGAQGTQSKVHRDIESSKKAGAILRSKKRAAKLCFAYESELSIRQSRSLCEAREVTREKSLGHRAVGIFGNQNFQLGKPS